MLETAAPDPTSLAATDHELWSKDLNQCESSAGKDRGAVSLPSQYYSMLRDFHDMLNELDTKLNTYQDGYQGCMATHGYTVNSYQDLLARIRAAVPTRSVDIPAPGETGNTVWQQGVQFESDALNADSTCRSTAYAAGQDMLNTAILAFEQQRVDELDSMQQQWQKIVTVADTMPGSPGFGPALPAPSNPS